MRKKLRKIVPKRELTTKEMLTQRVNHTVAKLTMDEFDNLPPEERRFGRYYNDQYGRNEAYKKEQKWTYDHKETKK